MADERLAFLGGGGGSAKLAGGGAVVRVTVQPAWSGEVAGMCW